MAGPVLAGKLLSPKSLRYFQQACKGYIVLLPEVSPEQLDTNPLYKNGIPDLENTTTEKCSSTFGKYILDFEHTVRETENKVVGNKEKPLHLFDDVVDQVEEAGAQMEATWGLLKTLYSVDSTLMPPDTYIPLHDRARKARSLKYTSRHIYSLFKNADISKLTEEEQRVVTKFRLEGKLNGLELGADGSELYSRTSIKLAQERENFGKKVKLSASKFSHLISDPMVTRDFPPDLLKSMSTNRLGNEQEGPWKVNLSHLNRFLKFCPDRRLRWNAWLAGRQVASVDSGSELNNSSTIESIRKLRKDIANILGYITYAHMSMETKMAGSLTKVQKVLDEILMKSRELQSHEIAELQDFAEERGFRGKLELWDVPFWERRQKLELFNWDERNIHEYFPYEKVIAGLLNVCAERCGLRFEVAKTKTWHQDAKLYHIYDHDSTKPIAGLYIDPFTRENKIPTPGQVICLRPSARVLGPSVPLAAMILSLPRPSKDLPCLVNFEDVEVIFKKFGQALQQLLCMTNYMEVSGLSFVEWDAVEVVSNIMTLWMNDPAVLGQISGHYKTGEPLPVTSLEDVRRHLSGFKMSTEVYKANLDIQLHSSNEFWVKVMKEIWGDHFVFELDEKDFHPCSFIQPFAGEFGAAYFSHIWAKMLAEDAYTSFKNEDIKAMGLRFRDTFLCFGGACHPNEVFRRFVGRDPSPVALLNSLGPKVPQQ